MRLATGEGRLTLDEFSDRLDVVFGARVATDLEPALAGLPVAAPQHVDARRAATIGAPTKRRKVIAVMSGATRRGSWRAPTHMTAVAFWGSVTLDLREAVLEGEFVDINAWAVMGGVEVYVPEGVPVDMDGMVIMGGSENRTTSAPVAPGAPIVRVHARGMWGGVSVRTKPAAEHAFQIAQQVFDRGLPPLEVPPTGSAPSPTVSSPTVSSPTVSILVTDIVGSTSIAERLGDQRWLAVLRSHDALVREQLEVHGGYEVKHVGDGFVVTFVSTRDAIRAACGIRRAMDGYRHGHPDTPLDLRMAVHAGEVERDGDDVLGVNVSTTSHLADLAAPGEILVSGVVYDLAVSTSDLTFGPARQVQIAGRSHPMIAHSVL